MKRHGNKPAVCLDEVWLSEIAKAHIDEDAETEEFYFTNLGAAIRTRVAEDKLVCPVPEFYLPDDAAGSEVVEALRNVSNGLGWGLLLNPSITVSQGQLLDAALGFAGLDVPRGPWWQVPFNRDPDAPTESVLSYGNGSVKVSIDEFTETVERFRSSTGDFDYHEFKEERRSEGLSYEEEVEYGRFQLFGEYHISPVLAIALQDIAPPEWEGFLQDSQEEYLAQRADLESVLDHGAGLEEFLASSEFESVPFFSIYAKLRAADIVYFPDRVPEPSLIEDFVHAATVIPYSRMFATSCYIAELLDITGIAQFYGCRTFTLQQKVDFLVEVVRQ